MLSNFILNIKLALTRNPKWFASSLFIGITALWGLCEPIFSTIEEPVNRYWFLIPFGLISLIIAFVRAWPKNKIDFKISKSNTSVHLHFGDLFSSDGLIGIGVNEYFDSQIGKPVSTESLHGYFIEKILGGKIQLFDESIKSELKGQHIAKDNREEGKSKKYEIGKTAKIEFGSKKYLLFALSKTNEKFEAYTNPSLLMKALNGLFDKARSECNGQNLNIPLVGSGLSRTGIPPKNLIELILIAILQSTKQSKITKNIVVVLHTDYYEEVDLNEIKRNWK